jgi:hypothetical protein
MQVRHPPVCVSGERSCCRPAPAEPSVEKLAGTSDRLQVTQLRQLTGAAHWTFGVQPLPHSVL